MPQAVRSNKKATKIAYDIIGKPENLNDRPIFKKKNIDAQIVREDTSRVK